MRRKPKRRLSVQNLENRRLFAADIGVSDAPYGPEVPAMVGSIRPEDVGPIALRPINDPDCPVCVSGAGLNQGSFINPEVNGEASEIERHPAPTETPPIVHGPINNGCPACDLEVNGEASEMDAEPKPTKIERPVFGPHFISFFSGSANDGSANA